MNGQHITGRMVHDSARRGTQQEFHPSFPGGAYDDKVDASFLGCGDDLFARRSVRYDLFGTGQTNLLCPFGKVGRGALDDLHG